MTVRDLTFYSLLKSADTFCSAYIKLAIYHAQIQINSIVLPRKQRAAAMFWEEADAEDWRKPALSRCLSAGNDFFDTFLSFDLNEYKNMTIAHWSYFIQALQILSRLCFDIPHIPSWDSREARRTTHLGIILESLCYRMQELTSAESSRSSIMRAGHGNFEAEDETEDSDPPSPPDHFFLFKSVLQILKTSYDERVKAISTGVESQLEQTWPKSNCPVVNGSLRKTEFWDAYEASSFSENEFDWLSNDEIENLDFGGTQDVAQDHVSLDNQDFNQFLPWPS